MIPPNADLLVWNFVIATADTSTKRRNFGGKVLIGTDFGGKIQILCRRPLAIQGGFNDRQRRTLAKISLNGIYVTHSVPKIELTLPKDVKPRFCTRPVATALNPTRDMLDVHRPQIDQVRLALAQEIIEMELHRPELNSATIARLSGMSIRTLERVFEPINGMARYIQERRLNLIQKAIASGEKANFDALATAHGFADRTYS